MIVYYNDIGLRSLVSQKYLSLNNATALVETRTAQPSTEDPHTTHRWLGPPPSPPCTMRA